MSPAGGDGGGGLAAFAPPRWLRSPHLQTILATSAWRRNRGAKALGATGAVTRPHVVDGGEGVRLLGLHSAVPGVQSRGLALLLHGWEGSAESSYMRLTAAELLARGVEAGDFRPDLDPVPAAQMVIGAMIGFSRSPAATIENFKPLRAELLRAVRNPSKDAPE